MNVLLSGHHLNVTPAMRQHVTDKFNRITKHFDHVIGADVIISAENLEHQVEANVHLRGKDIFVETHDPNMYAAIDALMDKLDRQLIKYKEKRFAHRSVNEPDAEGGRH